MRTLVICSLLLFSGVTAIGQQKVAFSNDGKEYLKLGDEMVQVKIIDMYPEKIFFKKDGEYYYVNKKDVSQALLLQESDYKPNGREPADELIASGQHLTVAVLIGLLGGGLATVVGIATEEPIAGLAVGGAATVVSLGFTFSGFSKLKMAGRKMKAGYYEL